MRSMVKRRWGQEGGRGAENEGEKE